MTVEREGSVFLEDVTIPPGVTLYAEPGATIDFSGASHMGVPVLVPLNTGRFTMGSSGTWYTSDENFGPNDENWNEARGSGTDPTWGNMEMGHTVLPGGSVIEQIFFKSRANNSSVSDYELFIGCAYPTLATANASGYDTAGEVTVDNVVRTTYSAYSSPTITAPATNDWVHQTFAPDYTVPATHDMGEIRMACKGTFGGSNRQLLCVWSMIVRLP